MYSFPWWVTRTERRRLLSSVFWIDLQRGVLGVRRRGWVIVPLVDVECRSLPILNSGGGYDYRIEVTIEGEPWVSESFYFPTPADMYGIITTIRGLRREKTFRRGVKFASYGSAPYLPLTEQTERGSHD